MKTRVAVAFLLGCLVWVIPPLIGGLIVGGAWYYWAAWTAAFVLGWSCSKVHPALLVAALYAGPFLMAGYTIDRGDEDGLWILIYPLLFFAAAIALVPAVLGRALARRGEMRE